MHAQACNRVNAQCVPLYDSLGENAIEFIINHSESSITFVSTEKLPALAKALSKTTEVLKTVIYWGAGHPASVEARSMWPCMRVQSHAMQELSLPSPTCRLPRASVTSCTPLRS